MDAEQKRWDDVSRAFSIVKRLRILQHEPLPIVLDRLGNRTLLQRAEFAKKKETHEKVICEKATCEKAICSLLGYTFVIMFSKKSKFSMKKSILILI